VVVPDFLTLILEKETAIELFLALAKALALAESGPITVILRQETAIGLFLALAKTWDPSAAEQSEFKNKVGTVLKAKDYIRKAEVGTGLGFGEGVERTPKNQIPSFTTEKEIKRRSMHPVEQKLWTIARYTVSAQKIKTHRHYIIFVVYSWTNELIVALAGIGITFAFLPPARAAAEVPVSPFHYGIIGGILALVWALLKLAATREEGIKRATLMRSCNHQIMVQRGKIYSALENATPLKELSAIFLELNRVYDRANQDGSWPWQGDFAPNIDALVDRDEKQWFNRWNERFGSTVSIDPQNLRSDE
jgi:hypothetical protein